MNQNLPVVMYHMVNTWPTRLLAISPALFEEHCKALAREKWHTVTLEEAEEYFKNGCPLPKKSVWLTFDDGYLDNYVYAYPILKKYGLKGTIFCVINRIEKEGTPRPTLDDVWARRIAPSALPRVDEPYLSHPLGFQTRSDLFLNWEEVRLLDASGVMQIASHSLTHGNVFIGPTFTGFIQPGSRHRSFDRLDYPDYVPWGLPAFTPKGALRFRAFLPSPDLVDGIMKIVPQDEKEAFSFFQNAAAVARLASFVQKFSPAELGAYESDEALKARLDHDMEMGKKRLEEELGRKVHTLCWPWGSCLPEAHAAARRAGYSVLVTTEAGPNRAKKDGEQVARFHVRNRSARGLLFRCRFLQDPTLARLYAWIRGGKKRTKPSPVL